MRNDHKFPTRISHDHIFILRRAQNKVHAIILFVSKALRHVIDEPLLKWKSQIIEVTGPLLLRAVFHLYQILLPSPPPHLPSFFLDSCGLGQDKSKFVVCVSRVLVPQNSNPPTPNGGFTFSFFHLKGTTGFRPGQK